MLRDTLAGRVEVAVRRDILSGALPPAARLRTADLSVRYGVSATPLREALQRLAEQGLVDLDPQIGARVADASLDDAREIYELRLLLEPRALEQSISAGGDGWLDDVEDAMARLRAVSRPSARRATASAAAWSEAHQAFHRALLAACDSVWLRRYIELLHPHAERYRNLARGTERVDRNELAEHEAMFRAVMERDRKAAVAGLENHLQTSMAVLEQVLTDMADADAS